MVSSTLKVDVLLQNRYRVIRALGRGGMGTVYEALDTRLSRTVALKETLAETDELRRAFERESRLLANLRHPALPKVLDHFSEGDGLFLVMEYIPGDDLSKMLAVRGRFDIEEVLQWADELLYALDYLHSRSVPILHRDIKPANLKLISPTQIVLLDFGLAKGVAGEMPSSIEQSLLGYSPNYSALEQIQGMGTDPRSDLYSLGATLYHLLTGTRPADAVTRVTAIVNGHEDPLPEAKELNTLIPRAVSDTLRRAMSLDIDRRPATAMEMLGDLHSNVPRTTGPKNEVERSTTSSQGSTGGAQSVAHDNDEQETVVRPRRKALKAGSIAVLSLGTIALLAGTTFLVYLTDRQPITIEAPPTSVEEQSPTPPSEVRRDEEIEPKPQELPRPEQIAARQELAEKNFLYTPESFARAIDDGKASVVELYLAGGMNPNGVGTTGRPVIVEAASRGREAIAGHLLRSGADVNSRDSQGATPLMEASYRAHKSTVRLLLSQGADVNRPDRDGRTALMRAAAEGHGEIVELLLARGARQEAKDRQGRDAQAWAQINGHSGVAELLQKAKARR